MKTIALKETTWEKLRQMRDKERLENFNQLVEELMKKAGNVPKSMLGVDKGKSYTLKEHEEFQRDSHG